MPAAPWFADVGRYAEQLPLFQLLQFKTHSPAASPANAGGLLQTPLSEMPRQRDSRYDSEVSGRVTPDKVLALIAGNPVTIP